MKHLSEKSFVILRSIVERINNGYLKLDSKSGYIPLVAENIGDYTFEKILYQKISLAHYGESNGDLMADPEMIFLFSNESRLAIPFYYKNDWIGIEQYSLVLEENKYLPKLQANQTEFAEMWMKNIAEQQKL